MFRDGNDLVITYRDTARPPRQSRIVFRNHFTISPIERFYFAGTYISAVRSTTGTDENELIVGTAGAESLFGGGGVDFMGGYLGNDIVNGGAGNDALSGEEGNDTLIGGPGADTFSADPGNDLIDGRLGADAMQDTYDAWLAPRGVVVNLANGTARDGYGGTDRLLGIEIAAGSSFADTLTGGSGNDTLYGHEGNDILDGGAGTGDTAFYEGNRREYQYSVSGNALVVTAGSNEGRDTLRNIEYLYFEENGERVAVADLRRTAGGRAIDVETARTSLPLSSSPSAAPTASSRMAGRMGLLSLLASL